MQAIAIALLLVLCASFLIVPSAAQSNCVCGTKRVLLVLADFPEYQHLSSRSDITHLFFGVVARYFTDVSYGRLSINGNSTDWITLPKLYDQYKVLGGQPDILAIAKDAFLAASQTFNFTSFDETYLVLSFYPSLTADYIQPPKQIPTKTGFVPAFAVVEEDRDWSAYARGFALSISLWNYRTQLTGLGQLDVASSGAGDMSAWSKLLLGWINDSEVLTVVAPPTKQIVTVSPIEAAQAQTYALRIYLGQDKDYFIEVREPLGYDRNNLQGYGVVVLYVPPSNASLQFKTALQPNNVGTAIFLDSEADLSVVVLNQTQTGFRLLIGGVQDGRDAQRTLYASSRATLAIQAAESENRINGLDLAKQLATNAYSLFTLGRFQEAAALAVSAETTANSASVPPEYSESVQLISMAEGLKNETVGLVSLQSLALVAQGKIQLDAAKQAFNAKNFTLAMRSAQGSIDLFNRAKQIDFTERIFGWVSTLALAIPVAILAYALRYQLKST
jgi:hypothetical protein